MSRVEWKVLAGCSVLAAAACAHGERRAPVDLALSHHGSRWDHLAARYDADGDGSIDRGEYPRDPVAFDRLDADADGRVTAADFADARPVPEQLLVQALLARTFHADGDRGALAAEDLETVLAARDADGDGRLGRSELEPLVDESRRPYPTVLAALLGERSEADVLLTALDRDGDARLSRAELFDYHRERFDPGLVRFVEMAPPPELLAEPGGPPPGSPAPDFTLRPPDGGPPVTLSGFAGERPVALLFGSYS